MHVKLSRAVGKKHAIASHHAIASRLASHVVAQALPGKKRAKTVLVNSKPKYRVVVAIKNIRSVG